MGIQKLEEIRYSFEEYLKLEETADFKSEFIDGLIVAMAGGTYNHNAICNNINGEVRSGLRKNGKECNSLSADMRIFLKKYNHIVYADGSVVCGKPEFHKDSKSVLNNPNLIIEVLSKSTNEYDKGKKFEKYRSLPSFQEYMLIWQTIPKVQTWYREEKNLWRISNVFGMDKSIKLFSIDCEIPLKDIYWRIEDLKEEDYLDSY